MTTLNLVVDANDEDAHERGDDTLFDDTFTECFIIAGDQTFLRWNSGFLFTGAGDISQADTINTCVATFECSTVVSDDPDFDAYFEKVAAPADFTATADVHNRSKTAASVAHDQVGVGADEWISDDLSVPLQEVVDALDITGGIMLLCFGHFNAGTGFKVETNETPAGTPAKLDVTFTGAAADIVLFRRRIEGD